jgi:hypothetical protein
MTIQFKLGNIARADRVPACDGVTANRNRIHASRLGRLRHHHRATAQNGTSSIQHHQLSDKLQEAQDF